VWVFFRVGFLGGCTQKNPPSFFLGTYPGVRTLNTVPTVNCSVPTFSCLPHVCATKDKDKAWW